MAWLVKAVDMTASARMPGTRKSIRGPDPVLISGSRLNPASRATGMIRVSSSCSPLRTRMRSSSPACAVIIRARGALPGSGAGHTAAVAGV